MSCSMYIWGGGGKVIGEVSDNPNKTFRLTDGYYQVIFKIDHAKRLIPKIVSTKGGGWGKVHLQSRDLPTPDKEIKRVKWSSVKC